MTRIFDALRKIQASRPAHAEPKGPLPPAPAPHPGGPRGASRPLALRTSHGVAPRPLVLPPGASATLPEDVMREMSTLRVSLESSLAERSPRIVAFVSSQAGEGTSTVALQFALALSQDAGIRSLLVDLHARRPTHPSEPAGAGSPTEGTVLAHLDILPLAAYYHSGGMIPGVDARQAFDTYGSAYDWLVLDGPPVLESPDAATLGTIADGVVMVVQAHRTKRPVLTRSVELLRKAGARVLGSVLNRRRLEIPEFIYRRI